MDDAEAMKEWEESRKPPANCWDKELWNADPECKHEVFQPPGGGVKCLHCPGWYCL